MTANVESQCPKCKGTGLHPEFGVQKGKAMQCLVCSGRGWIKVIVTPFDGLKRVPGVVRVHRGRGSRGDWTIYGEGVTYAEFMEYEDALAPDPADRACSPSRRHS